MGKFSRDKGARVERSIVNELQANGIGAERVPLSGAAGGKFSGDISVPLTINVGGALRSVDWTFEVKQRANGFKQIYDWLGDQDGLIIGRDRSQKLAVIPLTKLQQIIKAGEAVKS